MATSNTSRTLDYLRRQGWVCGIVERFIPIYGQKHGQRKDLFGFIDIIAINNAVILGVQSTGQAFAVHNRKILDSPLALDWLLSGGRLQLIGWRKLKVKRGGKAMRWYPRIKEYTPADFFLLDQSVKLIER